MTLDFISYEVLKMLHILSAFILFGTGIGTAFFGLTATLRGDISAIAFTYRHVVLADWIFTTPTIILQPLTGWLLMQKLGLDMTQPWIILTFILYGIAGLAWLPVVWLQYQMRNIAIETEEKSHHHEAKLPKRYYFYARLWFILGWPGFICVLSILWLMVAKPVLWG